jgi:tetratricopeptide (TPR) repeat protein
MATCIFYKYKIPRGRLNVFFVCLLLLTFCLRIASGEAQTLPPNTPATDDFLYAQKLFNEGYYELSVSQLRLFVQRYPDAQQSAEAWRLLGEANFALGNFAAAREAYETFEIRYPAHPTIEQARLRLAECLAKQGELKNAALNYQRFVAFHPKSEKAPEAQYRVAELWLQLGERSKAIATLYRLMEEYHGSDYHLPAHLLLVQVFEQVGDTQRALNEAERLLRSFPEQDLTARAYFVRARLQEAIGQFQLAESSYQELVTRFAPAEESRKTASAKSRPPVQDEWTSRAFARLAELANARGDLSSAINFLDKAEAQAPDLASKNAMVLRRAEMLFEMNEASRALQSLEKFDQADPDAAHRLIYLYTIGQLQEELQNDAAAAEAYRRATRLPRNVEVLSDSSNDRPQYRRQRSFWRGAAALFRLQKYNEALALCRSYRLEYPEGEFRDAVLLLKADIQRQGLGENAMALRLYQELLEKFPDSPFVDEAQWAVADAYERIGERRLAILEWRRFMRLYAGSEHFASAQCRLHLLGEFEPLDAPATMAKLTQLILAVSRNPSDLPAASRIALQLAQLHHERREWQQAITYCKQALKQQDESRIWQEALLLLGTCYYQLGERDRLCNLCSAQLASCLSTPAVRLAWFDSARVSLRPLAENMTAGENNDVIMSAGVLLARINFPPANPAIRDEQVLPRTPEMLARVDSTLARFADGAELDYLRVWAAQTRKHLVLANYQNKSPIQRTLLVTVDSLESERIIVALQKVAAADSSPWKNLALLELAEWRWLRGDSAGAVRNMAQLQNSPVKDPHIATGQLMLARWLAQRKNYDLALDQLATIRKRYSYSAMADSAAMLRIRFLMAANRYSEALQEMENLQAQRWSTPANRQTYGSTASNGQFFSARDDLALTRARALEATSEYPRAIRSYLLFLQQYQQAPEAPAVLLATARLTRQVGAIELATGYYEECITRFPGTPEAREAKLNLADMRYDAGAFEAARNMYMEVLNETPAADGNSSAWQSRAGKGAVLCLYKLKKASLAEAEVKAFRARFSDDRASLAEFQYAAGELAMAEKNFAEAEKIFKKLRDDYRHTPSAIYGDYGLGKAMLIQNKTEDALKVLTDIPQRYPNHSFLPAVYIGLGDFYQSQQQWDNAILAFAKVVQDSAFDNNYRLALRYLINVYDRMGLWDRALGLSRHYVNRFPDDERTFDLRIKIGVFLMNLLQFDDAISHFRALKPFADAISEPEIQYYIGKSYMNAGQFEQAIAELLRVKFFSKPGKLPWDVTALYESAVCYMRLKNYDRARQLFQQIVREQGAESEFGRFAKAKIAELEEMGKSQ